MVKKTTTNGTTNRNMEQTTIWKNDKMANKRTANSRKTQNTTKWERAKKRLTGKTTKLKNKLNIETTTKWKNDTNGNTTKRKQLHKGKTTKCKPTEWKNMTTWTSYKMDKLQNGENTTRRNGKTPICNTKNKEKNSKPNKQNR